MIFIQAQIQGKKGRGRPRTMFLDWLLKTEEDNISYDELKMLAQVRSRWCQWRWKPAMGRILQQQHYAPTSVARGHYKMMGGVCPSVRLSVSCRLRLSRRLHESCIGDKTVVKATCIHLYSDTSCSSGVDVSGVNTALKSLTSQMFSFSFKSLSSFSIVLMSCLSRPSSRSASFNMWSSVSSSFFFATWRPCIHHMSTNDSYNQNIST